MELAENVAGHPKSIMKPEHFDSKFGDSTYLVTDGAKSRLRGYLRTFGYMVFCGLLLLIGGGTFFIYESVVIKRLPETSDQQQIPSGRMAAPLQDEYAIKEKAQYSKEFQIVAFVFIGVGAVLFMVGVPFVSQFYRRYRRAKEVERSPILDPLDRNKKKGRIYTGSEKKPKSGQQKEGSATSKEDKTPLASSSKQSESRDRISFPKKTFRGKRRKSKTGWMYRSPQRISNESFRFASHRHPSMNHIQLDGVNFFDSAESSPRSSSDEETEENDTKKKPKGLRGFVNKIFSFGDEQKDLLVTPERKDTEQASGKDSKSPGNESSKQKDSTSSRQGETMTYEKPSKHSAYENIGEEELELDLSVSQGGLYNLG